MSDTYEELDHTADWALRIHGVDMGELCLHAASAMLAACGARPGTEAPVERRVSIQAGNREVLLVRWLQEVLHTIDAFHRLPTRIEVAVSPDLELSARWQETALAGIDKPIKAVTYSGLTVEETDGRLEATVVFDV
ncbi:MAG TPA: archease [Anaerolineales bacterium]|nr:archease [Anaerolineales bacterium]